MDAPKQEKDVFDDAEDCEKEGRVIFLNNKMWIMTYKTHIPKDLLQKFVEKKVNKTKAKVQELRIAHEWGDKKQPYPHTHVVVKCAPAFTTRKARTFDYEWDEEEIPKRFGNKRKEDSEEYHGRLTADDYAKPIHPNIKYIKTDTHYKRCLNYLAKEDPENADLKGADVDRGYRVIQNSETIGQALSQIPTGQWSSAIAGWNYVKNEGKKAELTNEEFLELELFYWQKAAFKMTMNKLPVRKLGERKYTEEEWENCEDSLEDLIKTYVDERDRIFKVFFNPETNCGKSVFQKLLMMYQPKKWICIEGVPPMRDLASLIKTHVDQGWTGHGICINFTKSMQDYKFYSGLESLRDGKLTSTKYQGEAFCVDIQHILVFCNFMPNIFATDPGRWEVYHIRHKDGRLHKLSIDQCAKIYKKEHPDLEIERGG